MSKIRSLHHIVFCTYQRFPAIPLSQKRELYRYIYGILKQKNCFVHRINGMGEHVHILIDLNPALALADVVRDVKRSSSIWMNENSNFLPNITWGKGYYAVSLGVDGLNDCINYIKNQEVHHRKASFMDEVRAMASQNQLAWYEDDWA